LRKLIAPMVSGIFAGDPETMSLASCFPRIAELEREYGGLIKAMLKLAKKKRQEIAVGNVTASPAGPGGVLTSFSDGIQSLTDILAGKLGAETVFANREVLRVTKGRSSPYRVLTGEGDMEADIVIMATPAYATANVLQELSDGISRVLRDIPYASMTVLCSGYEKERISHDLNGFGYLIPKEEGMNTLGTLWDSSIFDNRAPEGKVLLRSMLGGGCFPQYIKLSEAEVEERVRRDLQTIMGIREAPSFIRIFRHPQAIPQYTVGHGKRVVALGEKVSEHPGLFLTGNSYRGIGLNDCVAAANSTASEAVAYMQKALK
ncbi:MAG: protoporphyrinogen oxidase, partial [Geobacteraceae bacterium]